jgi:hypothetical protein
LSDLTCPQRSAFISKAPSFITETLNRIAGLLDDLRKFEGWLADAAAITSGTAAA